MPTFRSSSMVAASAFHELRKVMGTSKSIDSGAAYLFEVPGSSSPLVLQELQMGGTRLNKTVQAISA